MTPVQAWLCAIAGLLVILISLTVPPVRLVGVVLIAAACWAGVKNLRARR